VQRLSIDAYDVKFNTICSLTVVSTEASVQKRTPWNRLFSRKVDVHSTGKEIAFLLWKFT
jgi:hypothetical protein